MTARLLLVALLLAGSPAMAQDGPEAPASRPATPSPGKASLAVVPFGFRSEELRQRCQQPDLLVGPFERTAFTSMVVTALVGTRKLTVVDRQHLEQLLQEMELTSGGFIDPARAVEAGQGVSADYLLMGEIAAFEARVSWRPVPYGKGKEQRTVTIRIAADIRIVDSRTSKIVALERGVAAWQETKMFPNRFEDARLPADLLDSLQRELASDLVQRTIGRVYPIKVTGVKGQEHVLNRGKDQGLLVGALLDVYQEGGDDVVDLDTGEALGKGEVKIGQLRVTAVEEKLARAQPVSGGPFPEGAVCRPTRAKPVAPPSPATPSRKRPAGW